MSETKTRDKAGQPTKYQPEMCEKLIKFFDIDPWEVKDGKRMYCRMPTIEAFAKTISVCIATVYNWCDEKHGSFQAKFLDAFKEAQQLRKNWLIDVGLSGLAPANSFKFVAVNCTDMRDKQQTEHVVDKDTATLLGMIDGESKGKLPVETESEDAG